MVFTLCAVSVTGRQRTIRLALEALAALRAHRERQDEERLELGMDYADHRLIFPTRLGTPQYHRNVIRAFKALLAKVGLPTSVRFHDLHHTAGTDVPATSAILGHALPTSLTAAATRLQETIRGTD
ncbi:MAG: hypothetical protein CL878_03880 [Dehalococcoidia bacterium]|nr:hypothetical protein [Dehalococcoidia bacterium]